MKPTLLVLAAGMGSRYGGLKQLDKVGPSGETIMDYSIFDAIRAGFGKVVFVIRHDIEADFKATIGQRYAGKIDIDYAFQDINDLPSPFTVPEGRTKPWGTGQAVYAARKVVKEPFAVINADDFYGADAYKKISAFFAANADIVNQANYCMCAFVLKNTLSENGSVSRGICELNAQGNLSSVEEHTQIERQNEKIISVRNGDFNIEFLGNELVSMNFWGFTPKIFDQMESLFVEFLKAHGTELKSEFYIPLVADKLIKSHQATLKVLISNDSWFGVTYREDKPFVMASIEKLIQSGAYPNKLF